MIENRDSGVIKYLANRYAVLGVGAARDLPIPVKARDCFLAIGVLEEETPWLGAIRLGRTIGKRQVKAGLKSLVDAGFIESVSLTEQPDGEEEAYRVSAKGKPVYELLVRLLKSSEETFHNVLSRQ